MALRLAGWRGNALLAVSALTFTFAVLEVGARLILGSTPRGRRGEQALYGVFDERLGWRKKPGAVARYQRREFDVEVRINSRGLRGPEIAFAPEDRLDPRRVLLLGDSFVEAYTVAEPDSVAARLSSALSRPGCPIDVINGGTHGYSTDQELLFYRLEGHRYGASTVILFTYYNDVLYNIRPRYFGSFKPAFSDAWADSPANTPLPTPPPRVVEAETERPLPKTWGSVFLAYVIERVYTGAPRLYRRLANIGIVDPVEPERPSEEMRVYRTRGEGEEMNRAVRQTQGLIVRFARDVRARGARFVVVHVPIRFAVSDRDWDLTVTRYGLNEDAWDRHRLARLLSEAATTASASYIDLTDPLRRATTLFVEPYFVYDGHWNPLGHRIAAETVAKHLIEDGVFNACR